MALAARAEQSRPATFDITPGLTSCRTGEHGKDPNLRLLIRKSLLKRSAIRTPTPLEWTVSGQSVVEVFIGMRSVCASPSETSAKEAWRESRKIGHSATSLWHPGTHTSRN